jgi:aspartyl-tRNA(Asn)/glutamyl-tRNA(Gln) amidotransferase subunit A
VPDRDATVAILLRNAGAVCLGKLHMHEFAFGATSINQHYGPVRHPQDPDRIVGGSSGGAAAAVAASLCFGALGSDTGGSIRCPAALCGIVGLKPTYGRVSRSGVLPLAWSLDHVGPMTRTVEDAALMLEAIAGHDPEDPTSARRPVPPYARRLDGGVAGLRLGVPKEWFWSPIHPEVEARVRGAIAALEQEGASVHEVSLPCLSYAHAAQALILCSEAAAYHRRYLRSSAGEYGRSVRLRLLQGLFISGPEYLDAQRARRLVRREFLDCMRRVDALLTPAVPIPAPRISEEVVVVGEYAAPAQYFMVRDTFPFNLTGQPAVSVPCGLAAGLPVGLQIAGRLWDEETVLRIARAVEVWITRR